MAKNHKDHEPSYTPEEAAALGVDQSRNVDEENEIVKRNQDEAQHDADVDPDDVQDVRVVEDLTGDSSEESEVDFSQEDLDRAYPRPSQSAGRDAWDDWAVNTQRVEEDDLRNYTKADLQRLS